MKRIFLIMSIVLQSLSINAQQEDHARITLQILSEQQKALAHATAELLNAKDSSLVKTQISDSAGLVQFRNLDPGEYLCRISLINYHTQYSSFSLHKTNAKIVLPPVVLKPMASELGEITITAKKQLIELLPDRTIVNVDAGITNTGATVMEVLEKSPGVSVDRDGNISLKGKQGVLILIDDKPSYVNGSDLANLLNGMSASQLSTIEIMDNPPAKYDAAGSAGIINLRTKKNKQKGFNGNLSTTYGHGKYYKNNNNLQLNYRNNSFNFFFNYSLNVSQNFLKMYALRTYYKEDDQTIESQLEQPFYIKVTGNTHNLKSGIDYFLTQRTTLGLTFTGLHLERHNQSTGTARWKNVSGNIDSVITTRSDNKSKWDNGGINFNFRHVFAASSELSADIDYIGYRLGSNQFFENIFVSPPGYSDALKGNLPSIIHIYSAKADYTKGLGNNWKTSVGWKSARVTTDNNAGYFYRDGNEWKIDLGKTNHFIYEENIHAAYGNIEKKKEKWDLHAGLRYEFTNYHANQLGNAVIKDSSFSRKYNSLFPTAFISYKADSSNTFTFSTGRRIDRPGFQKLNPFLFVINKYTFQQGNPYFLPQYTWNFELSHLFKEILITSISYSNTKDYISQIFYRDTSNGTITYSEGNAARLQNFGVSVSVQASPLHWWSLSSQTSFNHKKIEGSLWKDYKASINQMQVSINNQFHFNKGWAAELSGFYISRNQNDLQEVLEPTGQVNAGISKQVLKNKGSLRLTMRDIFYTQAMEGLTHFVRTDEYFRLQRDTRVVTLAFNYRFGKAFKQIKHSSGGATDEMDRVGGN